MAYNRVSHYYQDVAGNWLEDKILVDDKEPFWNFSKQLIQLEFDTNGVPHVLLSRGSSAEGITYYYTKQRQDETWTEPQEVGRSSIFEQPLVRFTLESREPSLHKAAYRSFTDSKSRTHNLKFVEGLSGTAQLVDEVKGMGRALVSDEFRWQEAIPVDRLNDVTWQLGDNVWWVDVVLDNVGRAHVVWDQPGPGGNHEIYYSHQEE
jgi:hypothetical protein